MEIINRRMSVILLLIILVSLTSNCSISSDTTDLSLVTGQNKKALPENQASEPEFENQYLVQAWRNLTKDGKYRLAGKGDMKFSEATLQKEYEREHTDHFLYQSFDYTMGTLGYPVKKPLDHLAAIIVDTTAKDNNNFSFVIFSPENDSNKYRIFWVYKNIDLSTAAISTPSNYLILQKYSDDGSNQGCFVKWSNELNNFACK